MLALCFWRSGLRMYCATNTYQQKRRDTDAYGAGKASWNRRLCTPEPEATRHIYVPLLTTRRLSAHASTPLCICLLQAPRTAPALQAATSRTCSQGHTHRTRQVTRPPTQQQAGKGSRCQLTELLFPSHGRQVCCHRDHLHTTEIQPVYMACPLCKEVHGTSGCLLAPRRRRREERKAVTTCASSCNAT